MLHQLPALAELRESATPIAVPLHTRFRGVTERECLILHGPSGWAEFGPFPEYDDRESASWLSAAIEAGWGRWPEPTRDVVPVNATVPAVPAEQVASVLARFPGCATAKVKVAERGGSLDDDVARVAAVRDVLGVRGAIRVDANGAWSVPEALTALTAMASYGLEYAEQPCASVAELVALRAALDGDRVHVPLAADESIRKSADPFTVARTGACSVAILKVAPLGGVCAVVDAATRLAEEFGMSSVISSALETSVGMAAGIAAAAALPGQLKPCGLGTVSLLQDDVTTIRLIPVNGVLPVYRPDADPMLLSWHALQGERRDWWFDRLARCYAVLAARDDA